MIKILVLVLSAVIIVLAAVLLISKVCLDKENARLVNQLLADANSQTGRVFKETDLEGLPQPVRRYLRNVLTEGQPCVKTVRLEQKGEFRLGDATAPWKPLDAVQHFTTAPPGFIWDARIQMAPLTSVRVVDMYRNGEGGLRAKLLSLLTVAKAEPGPELNSGELMRYLAEAVWFPTALLPSAGVNWSPIDGNSATATLTHQGTTVSLVFHFNSRNEAERVTSENRYREVNGAFEPTGWTGHFGNYQLRNGMLIPIDGEVEWNLPDGDLSYWRGRLTEIEHRLAR